ncbi:branched-chain amino acid ABC transporter permease [Pantanalinema rosaneae CENA516]|uniref:branched-chain amino acid ABC transporter permease n=1 Tax=Pantanalinema rosaneae TaxID=1620701 RepID=UPI003D6EBFED
MTGFSLADFLAFFTPGNLVVLITLAAIYALFSLGLNLQWGFTGLINFGHVAFLTIGAYATVLLSLKGVPLILAVLVGAVLAAILGLGIGISTLRLREDYLAIVTIGVSEVVRLIALNEEWLTRGALGIPIPNQLLPLGNLTAPTFASRLVMVAIWTVIFAIGGWQVWRWMRRPPHDRGKPLEVATPTAIPVSNWLWGFAVGLIGLLLYQAGVSSLLFDYSYKSGLMLLVVVVLALVYWRLEVLVRSPWGRVLKAIREDEEVAKALGKNVFWYKIQSLMLGGAIAGVAGAFFAWNLTFINPDGFIPLITFYAWVMVVLGGSGNNAGTLLGAAIFQIYFTVTRFALPALIPLDDARLGALRLMVIGLLLIVLMMARPQGILGKKEELTLGR